MTIKATVIQDSVSSVANVRLVTFELEYPRFIHAELMTHRQFSRNAASSRAIPIDKMVQHVLDTPAYPLHWGANQAGMQAKAELEGQQKADAKYAWGEALMSAITWARQLSKLGLHKQIANRVTEPFQTMKTIVTATEWDNWFWLREHPDAQPEIHELARCMREAMDVSRPLTITADEWHVPYVERHRVTLESPVLYAVNGEQISVEEAQMISASCCAQVSYRKTDDSLEKARMVYSRLVDSEPVHASPVEHQATPMLRTNTYLGDDRVWEDGITHVDRKGNYWSGNFQAWIQFRQLIPNNAK